MQYNVQVPTNDNEVLEDDIDILFQQLESVEPPPLFVSHILQQVAAYTTSNVTEAGSTSFAPVNPLMWDEVDSWLEQQKKRSLC